MLDHPPKSRWCYEFDCKANGRKPKEANFSVRNGMKKDAVVVVVQWMHGN